MWGLVSESRPFGTLDNLVSGGVGGAACVNIMGICRVLAMLGAFTVGVLLFGHMT